MHSNKQIVHLPIDSASVNNTRPKLAQELSINDSLITAPRWPSVGGPFCTLGQLSPVSPPYEAAYSPGWGPAAYTGPCPPTVPLSQQPTSPVQCPPTDLPIAPHSAAQHSLLPMEDNIHKRILGQIVQLFSSCCLIMAMIPNSNCIQ